MYFSEKIVQYIITLLLVFSISVNEHFHVSAAPSLTPSHCLCSSDIAAKFSPNTYQYNKRDLSTVLH